MYSGLTILYVGAIISVTVGFHCVLCTGATHNLDYQDVNHCSTSPATCQHGECINDTCVCQHGWTGRLCEYCVGKVSISDQNEGYITDGNGNYTLNTKCSWLIDSGTNRSSIRIKLGEFATECSWDHLFVYDGDSVYDPLVAVFSGLLKTGNQISQDILHEVVTHSGKAFLHFFSDAAYNMSGFNISFHVSSCPNNCTGNGMCVNGTCECDVFWEGTSCELPLCPNNCSYPNGECDILKRLCVCNETYKGEDCSSTDSDAAWSYMYTHDTYIKGRASHCAVVYQDYMWVIGGEMFNNNNFHYLDRYDFINQRWEEIKPALSTTTPSRRYGHSVVVDEDKSYFYMFGGLIASINVTNQLWLYHPRMNTWTSLKTTAYAAVGHTAHFIRGIMYIIFGHSPVYGFMNTVQECAVNTGNCSVAVTSGAIVKGSYGHTSIYDGRYIYIHGGYQSSSTMNSHLTDTLYMYDPIKRYWRYRRESGQYRYLHSAVIMGTTMLVFGGNTHNDTSASNGAKCFSNNFLAYDTRPGCDSWSVLPTPKLHKRVARFGHSAVVYKGKMYVFGGFNGFMLNDFLEYSPGLCELNANRTSCLKTKPGVSCAWVWGEGCKDYDEAMTYNSSLIEYSSCQIHTDTSSRKCYNAYYNKTCPSCVENSYQCAWCVDGCMDASKCTSQHAIHRTAKCPPPYSHHCVTLHNCNACQLDKSCEWKSRQCKYVGNIQSASKKAEPVKCSASCYTYKSCNACIDATCMWCGKQQRCVESNAYVTSFPYGQCMDWVNANSNSKCPSSNCSELTMCESCESNPQCGWCEDGSNTGLGMCLPGGNQGPVKYLTNGTYVYDTKQCPVDRWFFTKCPACQCNGHSQCPENSTVCMECRDLTQGKQCNTCIDGFYGDPTNGGNCTACQCNGHAVMCEKTKGACFCQTKGIIGQQCDKCDIDNYYFGNPTGGGTCYYDLATDYQFTFNLSNDDDKHYTRINFKSTPSAKDKDLEFLITCSANASFNITYYTNDLQGERPIHSSQTCTKFKKNFDHKHYKFSDKSNTTFYVYVYNFKSPILVKISFSQFPKIDLITFFITFFSCFSSLLVIAIIIWKIKIRYVLYLSRQRVIVQMQQMASRPFSQISLDIERDNAECLVKDRRQVDSNSSLRKRARFNKPIKPSPISMELLSGQKVAILSLFIQLPTGDSDHSPPSQSGLAVASTLVAIGGHIRGNSVDHTAIAIKDTKTKKVSSAATNCI